VGIWFDPDKKGSALPIEFEISRVPSNSRVRVSRADSEHGNTLAAYQKMGQPAVSNAGAK